MKKVSKNVSECIGKFVEEMKALQGRDYDVDFEIKQDRPIVPTYDSSSDETVFEKKGPTTYTITVIDRK